MSLIWCDVPSGSTGIFNDDESLTTEGLYAQFTMVFANDPDPAIGAAGKVWTQSGSGDKLARWILPAARTEVGMGCRIYLANIPVESDRAVALHQYRSAANTNLVSVVISTSGSIQIRSGGYEGTLLAETAQDVISAEAWRHVESEITFDASAGTAKVWIEGALVLDASALNTGATACGQVAFVSNVDGTNARTTTYFKDIFIRDDQGTVNNGQIGSCSVYLLKPNADVSSGWTPSSGTEDFSLLDDSPPVDTDYISADDSPPAPSIMNFENLPADIIAVRGLVTVARALKTDGGDGSLQVSLSPNGTDWDTGADNPVTTTYTFDHDVSELSPATGVAWTPLEVDAGSIRLDRTV
jgi:hypothetical protein